MNNYEIEGLFDNNKKLILKDIGLMINIPEWIDERYVYNINKEIIGSIKPSKYGGLTYKIYDIIDNFAKINTSTYGECLVQITEITKITNYNLYERGDF